jgi:hypothetical protein
MSENAPAQPDEAEREALAFWYIERAASFDPAMLSGMFRGACGAPTAIEHGQNHEFVTMPRYVFIRLVKASRQEHSQPENENHLTRQP